MCFMQKTSIPVPQIAKILFRKTTSTIFLLHTMQKDNPSAKVFVYFDIIYTAENKRV